MPELFNLSLFSDANLQAYWRFEGNSNDSKNSNNGTDTNITYNTGNGKYGQGAGFNGSTSKISIGGITITGNLTFAGWINITSFPGATAMLLAAATNGVQFFIDNVGKLNLAKNGTAVIGTSTSSVGTGRRRHVAVTYDGTTARFYIDGIPDGTGSSAQTFSVAVTRIGVDNPDSSFFNGSIDDLAIFDRVLTEAEIKTLIDAQGGVFLQNFI